MRVNKQTELEKFAKSDAISTRLKKKMGATTFTPRQRKENEALPRTYTTHGHQWTHHSMEPARSSANDHLAYKSKGYRT